MNSHSILYYQQKQVHREHQQHPYHLEAVPEEERRVHDLQSGQHQHRFFSFFFLLFNKAPRQKHRGHLEDDHELLETALLLAKKHPARADRRQPLEAELVRLL